MSVPCPFIFRLPVEVLTEILVLASCEWGLSPVAYTHVNSRLRTIMLQSPACWTLIDVDMGRKSVKLLRKRLQVYLKRSAPHLVTISIHYKQDGDLEHSFHLFTTVTRHLNRVRALNISGNFDIRFPFSMSMAPGPVPYMETFRMRQLGLRARLPARLFSRSLPKLCTLDVHIFHRTDIAFLLNLHPTLTTLRITTSSNEGSEPQLLDSLVSLIDKQASTLE